MSAAAWSAKAPVGCASQARELGYLAGELGEDEALDELVQHQPLVLAVFNMVLADRRLSSQNRTEILPGPRQAQVMPLYAH